MEPPPVDEMRRRIRETLEALPWLVCEQDGMLLGYAYAGKHRARAAYQWSVDTSVYIHEQARRAGVGRALYTSLFSTLRLLGYFNACAGVTLPNPGSVGLHEAMGFKPVGVYPGIGYKFGAWHDVGWWQLDLQPKMNSPQPPLNIHTITHGQEWEAALAAGEILLSSRD
jgi:phosphinothricin acetyltransferase